MFKYLISLCAVGAYASPCAAQEAADTTDSGGKELQEVVITAGKGTRKLRGATNSELIPASELKRAACCNLGESFTTNPSVDVNYNDAATGARQIRLLGLSGSYVQFLTENVPAFRGAASPYGLGYIAGPWMQSIQVSKGASSVKNGYESITGQINVEMKKPQADQSLSANLYYDSMNKLEVNVDGNVHAGRGWSAGLLTHFENGFTAHDGNDDGFTDMPRVRQVALMPRVAWLGGDIIMQAAAKYLDERRLGGQTTHHGGNTTDAHPYEIRLDTRRWEAFTKTAWMLDKTGDGNVALILSGNGHDMDSRYGHRLCDIDQHEFYGSAMFERTWGDGLHALSTGLQATYDHYRYTTLLDPEAAYMPHSSSEHEAVGGAYAQYTLNLDGALIAMAGLRYDWSDLYGSMVTPRVHIRYNLSDGLTLQASAGRGCRTPHPLAEYSYLLASSRQMSTAVELKRESAWNFGIGGTWTFHLRGRKGSLSGEYYHTRFDSQLIANLDMDPHKVYIYSDGGRSYSHSLQVEAGIDLLPELNVTAAWRFTSVKADYTGHGLSQKPLTPRHKALFTVGYSPRMGLWQFDVTCALNGSGRMPTPYTLPDGSLSWSRRFPGFAQVNAQVTRNFRHWAVYIGGENLTGYRQKHPIIGAGDPWGPDFDATMVYGPLQGAMFYVGFRYNIVKY